MTKLRKVQNEREARALLAKVKAAGVDLGAWARAHGIDGRSLHAWYRNLSRRGRSAPSRGRPRAAALRVVEIVGPPATSAGGRYVVRVAGAEVELDDAFEEETLRRILTVLRSC